jgi:hypothetical protein
MTSFDGRWYSMRRVLLLGLLVGLGALIVVPLPDIKRYKRISTM